MGHFYRPIIPIVLKHRNIITDSFGLVDSGSDITILHGDIAYLLDIDTTTLEVFEFSGVKKGNDAIVKGYLSSLEAGIDDEFFKIPVIFSFDIANSEFGILGQAGFFDTFTIEFDKRNRKIILK